MAFLGWRKWPTPIVKPLWPFMIAASISLYGVSKLQDMAVRSPTYAKDPKNPYAAQIAAEEHAKLGGH
ncbi:ATPase, F0 complex, subunit J [Mycena sp. CBHHK59/15]|nr:ATPase, F0 complex, subunit J [Mycena sp. CBHHK59/15]KAJ6626831.1 ATPase, F0 complex, subunit J [Mycena sp. CBHHK59/15]